MTFYPITLLVKLLGVSLYAGGMIASFVATSPAERKLAVHNISSPALAVTWAAGYALTLQRGIPLTEFWIVGGLLFSLLSQSALVYAVARQQRTRLTVCAALLPFVLVLVFMIWRPTWAGLLS